MIRAIRFAALMLLVAGSSGHAAIVATNTGAVEGVRTGSLAIYKGIPFAAPPVGALRWREPQAVEPWRGVRKVEAFAPACMQVGTSMPGEKPPRVSEDCLYLNVWAPVRARKLPVIVWIYGGGFTNGSASMPLYWGDRLARRGAVVVTFGYRVGPFGFLAHPELTAESPHHSSGNYGLLDQIAALRWVRKNIAAFGGDPARVTVAGQSAGAVSVSLLVASPLAKGLFSRAIAQSGGLFEPVEVAPAYYLTSAEKTGEAYAQSLGAKSLADLRAMPATTLLGGLAGAVSHPIIDADVLPLPPYDAYVERKQNDVPILVGSNADEAKSLIPDVSNIRAKSFEQDIWQSWSQFPRSLLPSSLLAAYPHQDDAQARKARLAFERDLRFGWDMWAWARLQAIKSRRPAYYYHFTEEPPFPAGSVYQDWGPSHFAELWYMFDHLDQQPWKWSRADRSLSNAMASYWINFARSGDPNGPGLPRWPRYAGSNGATQYLGDKIHSGSVAHLDTLSVFDATYSAARKRPFGKAADR
jgi:para-nitrobenzyl esterase